MLRSCFTLKKQWKQDNIIKVGNLKRQFENVFIAVIYSSSESQYIPMENVCFHMSCNRVLQQLTETCW